MSKLINILFVKYVLEYIDAFSEYYSNSTLINISAFYKSIGDFEQMRKYLFRACFNSLYIRPSNKMVKTHTSAYPELHLLAVYYEKVKPNTKLMLKYYDLAIKRHNPISMNNMGYYYKSINNIPMAKNYYVQAIEHSYISSANNLAYIYQFDDVDVDLMLYYYNMVLNSDNATLSDKKTALFHLGYFYQYNKPNQTLMLKYYNQAIELEDDSSMFNLGFYYFVSKKYDLMKKYFNMSIKYNNCSAMNYMANYYIKHEPNHKKVIEYFNMAVQQKDHSAMNNLGYYYQFVMIDYELAKKYYLMAIEYSNTFAMTNLANYYKIVENNIDQMIKYSLMAVKLKYSSDAINQISDYYISKSNTIKYNEIDPFMVKYYIKLRSLKEIKETICCPISYEETDITFETKCGHKFSYLIFFINCCPLCRSDLNLT